MRVWPDVSSSRSSLCGSEGALVSVSVHVAPRDLEDLLDALAQVDFPINPQIYHDAAMVYCYADGREEIEPATIVEFPAYEGRLPEVRNMLNARGFGADCLHVTEMLDQIHSDGVVEPAPPGAPYNSRICRKHAPAAAAAAH